MKEKDARIKMMNEVLNGIKVCSGRASLSPILKVVSLIGRPALIISFTGNEFLSCPELLRSVSC